MEHDGHTRAVHLLNRANTFHYAILYVQGISGTEEQWSTVRRVEREMFVEHFNSVRDIARYHKSGNVL